MIEMPDEVKQDLRWCPVRGNRSPVLLEQGLFLLIIPKNASISMRALAAALQHGDKVAGMHPEEQAQQDLLSIWRRYVPRCQNYKAIAIVRHPLDRFVSAYWDKRDDRAFLKANKMKANRTIREWVRWICNVPDDKTDPHLRPQHMYLYAEGAPIDVELLRFEDLPGAADELLQRYKLPARFPHAHFGRIRSKQKAQRYWEDLPYRQVLRLTRRYKRDFKLLGYPLPVSLK